MKKKILFVCLGNICRSPAAEAVFINLLRKNNLQDKFDVDSAGTGGWHVGKKADSRMREAALRRGIKIESIARQINEKDFNYFDIIITMDSDNYKNVLNLSKQCNLAFVPDVRPMLTFSSTFNCKDVPDPYYGGDEGFENVLNMLDLACSGLIEQLIND